MKKVAIIFGTRPEAIKLIPIYKQLLSSRKIKPVLVSTGQHKEMLDHVLSFFKVKPDIIMHLMSQDQSLAESASRILKSISNMLEKFKFDAVIVQGDTTTAFVSAMAAYYNRTPVIHVEAGLRTNDIYAPFPEEVNRKLIASIAQINFTPTLQAARNLLRENAKNIFLVGNTVVDAAKLCLKSVKKNEKAYRTFFNKKTGNYSRYCLITGHRRESFGKGLENICNAVKILASKYPDVCFIYPVHYNPNVQAPVKILLRGIRNICLMEALPYDKLIYIMSKSTIIMTDSGGIQEEAPTFHVPVLVMREKTERNEGIKAGCAILTGTSTEKIVRNFIKIMSNHKLYKRMSSVENPYGDGNTAKKIGAILERYIV